MSGNAQHEVIPLSKYLGTNSWSFDKGCGIRKWDLVENCDETFTENFLDKIKKAISKSRTRRGASFKVLMQSFSTLNSEDEFSPPEQLDVSNLKIVQNDSGHDAALNSEEFSTSQTKPLVVCSSIAKTNTTVVLLNPVSSSSPYDSKSQMKACELSDVLWNSLNDSRQYVNIEGLRCPKLLLTELATRYLNSSGLKDTALASVQTDLPKSEAPEISVGCQTETVPPTLSDSRGRSEEINKSLLGMPPVEFANHQNFTWNKWNDTHDAKVQTNQTMYYPSYQHSVQSQSSQFRNYSGQHHQNTRINQTKLNAALNWKPRNNKQKQAFEQAKQDLFNLLVAYKGISYNHVIKQFLRTVQEPLDFYRIGICDLRSLLVQMKDLIILKKRQFTEEYFLFPKMNNDEFNNVSHIAELVAEQRDRDVVQLPNEATLVECNISELFEEKIPQTTNRYPNPSDFSSYQMYLNYCWYYAYNLNNYNQITQNNYYGQHQNQQQGALNNYYSQHQIQQQSALNNYYSQHQIQQQSALNNYYSQHQNQQHQFYQQNYSEYSEYMRMQQNTMTYQNNMPSPSYYRR